MGFINAYATNLVAWAGIVGAYGLFTGTINDLTQWFKEHPDIMIPALIVHLGFFALSWKVKSDLRAAAGRGKRRRK